MDDLRQRPIPAIEQERSGTAGVRLRTTSRTKNGGRLLPSLFHYFLDRHVRNVISEMLRAEHFQTLRSLEGIAPAKP